MINPYIILSVVAVMFIIAFSCFLIDVSTGFEEDATIAVNTNNVDDEVSLSSLSLEEDDEYEDADVLILDDLT